MAKYIDSAGIYDVILPSANKNQPNENNASSLEKVDC